MISLFLKRAEYKGENKMRLLRKILRCFVCYNIQKRLVKSYASLYIPYSELIAMIADHIILRKNRGSCKKGLILMLRNLEIWRVIVLC